jgi:hypothetical protein
MKTASQGNIRKEEEILAKVAKQAKNKVSGLYIDLSSLPKEIRKEIYSDLLK